MHTRIRTLGAVALGVVLLAGCGAPIDGDPAGTGQDGATETTPEETEDTQAPTDGLEDFDRDRARERAEALLGLPEDEVEESRDTRIVRRGDEEFAVTMDLQPGRRNVELDEDDEGTYVVTRVEVEVPDGEDPLVVE